MYITNYLNNTPNRTTDHVMCNPINTTWAVGLAVMPLFMVICNTMIIIATYRSRHKLRHNYVYAYVISVLMGNVIYGAMSLYNILNYACNFERVWKNTNQFNVDPSNPFHVCLQKWWTFRRALSVGLFLVSNANVSALIYGISDSSYFVGRIVASDIVSNRKEESIRKRRSKASIIIGAVWSIPVILGLTGLFWNCLENCFCFYADYGGDFNYCKTDIKRSCSRIWQPLTSSFLGGVTFVWCIEVIGIVTMLVLVITRSLKVTKPTACVIVTSPHHEDSTNNAWAIPTPGSNAPPFEEVENRKVTSEMLSTQRTQCRFYNSSSVTSTNKLTIPKTTNKTPFRNACSNPTVQLLLIIATFFVSTSLPSMVVILIDVFNVKYALMRHAVPAVIIISMLYGIFLPFILVYYMAGLRAAVQSLFLTIRFCTTTTIRMTSVSEVPRTLSM